MGYTYSHPVKRWLSPLFECSESLPIFIYKVPVHGAVWAPRLEAATEPILPKSSLPLWNAGWALPTVYRFGLPIQDSPFLLDAARVFQLNQADQIQVGLSRPMQWAAAPIGSSESPASDVSHRAPYSPAGLTHSMLQVASSRLMLHGLSWSPCLLLANSNPFLFMECNFVGLIDKFILWLQSHAHLLLWGSSLGLGYIPSSEPSLRTARQICLIFAQSDYM